MELNAHIPEGPIEQKWDKHRFDLKLVDGAFGDVSIQCHGSLLRYVLSWELSG